MKSTELRIGNWVADGLGQYHQVTAGTIIFVDEDESKCIKPIELNEQILLKCGFENDYTQQSWHHRTFLINDFQIEEIEGQYFYNRLSISSLHQLQNLYFSLTNQELQIKL